MTPSSPGAFSESVRPSNRALALRCRGADRNNGKPAIRRARFVVDEVAVALLGGSIAPLPQVSGVIVAVRVLATRRVEPTNLSCLLPFSGVVRVRCSALNR